MSLSEDGGLVAGGGGGLAGDGERAAGDEADGRREADGDEADGLREAGGDAAAAGGLAGDTVDSVRTADAGDTAAAAGDTAAAGDRGDRDDANDARSRRRSRMSSSEDSAAKATDRCQACLPKEGIEDARGDGDGRSEFSTSARDGVRGAGPGRKAAAVASSGSSGEGRLGDAGAGGLAFDERGDSAAAALNRFSQASRPFHVAALNLLPTSAPGTPTSSNSNATPFVSVAATASTRR